MGHMMWNQRGRTASDVGIFRPGKSVIFGFMRHWAAFIGMNMGLPTMLYPVLNKTSIIKVSEVNPLVRIWIFFWSCCAGVDWSRSLSPLQSIIFLRQHPQCNTVNHPGTDEEYCTCLKRARARAGALNSFSPALSIMMVHPYWRILFYGWTVAALQAASSNRNT